LYGKAGWGKKQNLYFFTIYKKYSYNKFYL